MRGCCLHQFKKYAVAVTVTIAIAMNLFEEFTVIRVTTYFN
jgi:hypothetical protein